MVYLCNLLDIFNNNQEHKRMCLKIDFTDIVLWENMLLQKFRRIIACDYLAKYHKFQFKHTSLQDQNINI